MTAVAVTAAVRSATALTAASARAADTTMYVGGTGCSDIDISASNPSQPYSTISAAADAGPGQ